MTVGKNKRLTRGRGGKGVKKKVMDPFVRKDWYDVKAPATFEVRKIGKTPVNKSAGTKLSSDALKGRVFEVSLGDLSTANSENVFRKFKLISEEVDDKTVLTNFHGMTLTSDKLKSMVKKNQTMIEAFTDVKTTDGYTLRLFCIGFTNKPDHQAKKTCYAKTSKCKAIRRKMVEIMTKEISSVDLKQVIHKLIPDSIARDITKACGALFPMKDVAIRKVKVLKKPKFDITKLMDMYGDSGKTGPVSGEAITKESYEPPLQESV